ncbi:MAG: hypothetical protein ACWGQW_24730, partial [bacterium]
ETDGSAAVKFLALFVPYPSGESQPKVQTVDYGDIRGFQIGEERVVAWWGVGEAGTLSQEQGKGRMLVESVMQGSRKTVLCE